MTDLELPRDRPEASCVGTRLLEAGICDRPLSIELMTRGLLNTVYRVCFSMRPSVVVRVRHFINAEYGQEFAAERFAYILLEGTGVRVPGLLFCDETGGLEGAPFAIFDHIPGVTLDRVLADRSVPMERRKRLLQRLATSLAEIHRLRGAGFGTLTSVTHSSAERREFFSALFLREEGRLARLSRPLAQMYRSRVSAWLTFIDSLASSLGDPCLVHGDLHGRNIIVTDEDELFLIDWEASRLRIPAFDFAQFEYVNLRESPEGMTSFLDDYLRVADPSMDAENLRCVISLVRAYWHCRMGLYLREFGVEDVAYFGSAESHIEEFERLLTVTGTPNA